MQLYIYYIQQLLNCIVPLLFKKSVFHAIRNFVKADCITILVLAAQM